LLGVPTPRYAHLPIVTDATGEKLSKQSGARAITDEPPLPLLRRVLDFLGQEMPAARDADSIDSFWRYAIADWRAERVPRTRSAVIPPGR
jgi:glutamyl-Q tRNA(Asp) synthetase